jgi:5'-3' exonuclease
MDKKSLLLVDFNNLLFRAVFAHDTLSHKGQFTGGLFGAIDMICSTVNRYNIDRVVICHDTKPYYRTKFYPKYKGDRKHDFDEDRLMQLAVSRKQLNKFFADFRFPVAMAEGFEADDFIGDICRTVSTTRYRQIFIMSNDTDFYQLLTGRVFLCKTQGLYGRKDFREDFPGIKPRQWPRAVALMGSHNGVPGIKGVGIKTAYKAVLNKMTDKEIFKKWRVRRSTVKQRTDLSTFPFPLAEAPPTPAAHRLKYSAAKFEKLCDKYGINFKDEFHKALMRLAT